ncbi:MAG: hypothetical protein IKF72_09475 [Kiritimatiellae bacterium]|nr:hypothetical protein [Kiritimatiellia bacterium]
MDNPKTPYFLVDEARIVVSIQSIRSSLDRYWPNNAISYSVKTNSIPCVLKVISKLDVWAEVVSDAEYVLAQECGFSARQSICNGPIKSDSFLKSAIESGALINVDSVAEVIRVMQIAAGQYVKLGVRLNANDAIDSSDMMCGDGGSRFGVSERDGELRCLLDLVAENKNISVSGIHLHCNTKGRRKENYARLVEYFSKIVHQYDIKSIDVFDIGGSFGHDFDKQGNMFGLWPSWDDYFSTIANELSKNGFSSRALKLIIEPGSSLISDAMDYYTTCLSRKTIFGKTWMQIDGSRIHIDPHFTRKSFLGTIECIANLPVQKERSQYFCSVLSGNTCLEKDRIYVDGHPLECSPGDKLRFKRVGAYTYGLSPCMFITPPPEIWFMAKVGEMTRERMPQWIGKMH